MICNNCGSEVPNGSAFCKHCGIQFSQRNTNEDLLGDETNSGNTADKTPRTFINQDEYEIARMGNGYISNSLYGSLAAQNISLTNRRVYFQGKLYDFTGRTAHKVEVNEIVNVEDITGVRIQTIKNIMALIWAWVLLLVGVMSLITQGGGMDSPVGAVLLVGAAIALGIYFLSKHTYLVCEYAGGIIGTRLVLGSVNKARDFQKAVFTVKDSRER